MNTLSSLLNFIGGKIAAHDDSIYMVKESDSYAEQITLASGAFGNVSAPINAIEGYTPVGIVGIRKNGGSNNGVAISAYYVGDTAAYVGLVNGSSSSKTVGVKVTVLYKKVGG